MDSAPSSEPDAQGRASGYAWYALGVMTIVYALSFIDRQILSILAEEIRNDLDLDDAELGFLYGTAFAIFYAVFGIPLGRLADSWRRGRLMALGLALWSAMTVFSGFATSFLALAVARVGVGIGEASASPAAFSMLGDYFPKSRRALANSIYSSGLFIGMGLSLPIGGAISQGWNEAFGAAAPFGLAGWQAAFIAVGVPGLFVAAWVYSLKEPARRGLAGDTPAPSDAEAWKLFGAELLAILPPFTLWSLSRFPGALKANIAILIAVIAIVTALILLTKDVVQWSAYGVGLYAIASWVQGLRFKDRAAFKLIWGTPEVLIAILGFGSLAVITYGVSFWAAPYAMRTFGLDAKTVGFAIGVPGAIAAAIGVIAGGRLSDTWKSRDVRGRLFTCMLSAAAPVPFIVLQYHAADFAVYVALSAVVYGLANMWVGSAVAAYQDFVLPRMYGTISATYLIGSTMIGLAVGPYGSGKVAVITGDLRAGVFSLLLFPLVSLFCLWMVSRNIGRLEETKVARAREAGESGKAVVSHA